SAPRFDRVAETAQALDRAGLHERSGILLARAVAAYDEAPSADATWLAEAFDTHLARTADDVFTAAVVEAAAAIGSAWEGRAGTGAPPRRRVRALGAVARTLERAGQSRAARRAVRAAERVGGTNPGTDPVPVDDRLVALVAARHELSNGAGPAAWDLLD